MEKENLWYKIQIKNFKKTIMWLNYFVSQYLKKWNSGFLEYWFWPVTETNGYNVALNPLTTNLCCGGGIPSFSSTRSFILSTCFETGEKFWEIRYF